MPWGVSHTQRGSWNGDPTSSGGIRTPWDGSVLRAPGQEAGSPLAGSPQQASMWHMGMNDYGCPWGEMNEKGETVSHGCCLFSHARHHSGCQAHLPSLPLRWRTKDLEPFYPEAMPSLSPSLECPWPAPLPHAVPFLHHSFDESTLPFARLHMLFPCNSSPRQCLWGFPPDILELGISC